MKTSFVTTVLNEEKNIGMLLSSVFHQSKKPDEIIFVDGGSRDNTVNIIKEFISSIKSDKSREKFKLIFNKGNRSIGRNEGIKKAKGDIILLSDAGCFLDKNWVKNIIKPFSDQRIDVVAGFYKGFARNMFEKCLIPYVLVMPDKINPKTFLPSGRSMAFRKSIWQKTGEFPKNYSNNEDYVFAHRLKKINAKIIFRKNAIVYWLPRRNIFEAFIMFFRFSFGDAEAGILRKKVLFLFFRYIFGLWLLAYCLYISVYFMLQLIFYILVVYIIWAIWKNYKYIKEKSAFLYLPIIQFTADFAILFGTTFGFIKGIWDIQAKQ